MNYKKLVLWNLSKPLEKRVSVSGIEQWRKIAPMRARVAALHASIRREVDVILAARPQEITYE